MASHRDDDAAIPFDKGLFTREIEERMDGLRKRADEMTEQGLNRITAGQSGEEPLSSMTARGLLITRMPDDPFGVLRISIGEALYAENSAYLVYRGDPQQIEALLKRALKAMKATRDAGEGT